MKKLLALLLAVAMVLSLSAVAMADSYARTQISPDNQGPIYMVTDERKTQEEDGGIWLDYTFLDDELCAPVEFELISEYVPYGYTLYLPLYYKVSENNFAPITSADAVSDLKVSGKWESNGSFIEGVSLEKHEGGWCIAIDTAKSDLLDETVVEGDITLKGKAYESADAEKKTSAKNSVKDVDQKVSVIITLGYADITAASEEKEDTDFPYILGYPYLYSFDTDDEKQEEYEFEVVDFNWSLLNAADANGSGAEILETTGVTFTVDTTHQDDVVLQMRTKTLEEIEKQYPNANLDYYTFNGATFRKTGELYIPADEGSYLYEVVDGKLQATDATYDEYEEAFTLKTKTLGSYVVSDAELEIAAVSAVADTAAANPTTGAAL